MNIPTIHCPECNTEITLSETLAAEHIEAERALHRKAIVDLKTTYERKSEAVAEREQKLTKAEGKLQETLAAERGQLKQQIEATVRKDMQSELASVELRLTEKDQKLKNAESLELESRKRMTDADEKVRQAELQVQRRLDEERTAIREKALNESGEESERKIAEKDQVIEQMNKRIELLARQADSKSQQLQGELEEQNIFNRLREHFPADELVRIPKGRNGADIVFKVKSPSGRVAGTVLIEVKDTQNFDNKWIGKLKSDTHDQNANIGVIVSRAMPADVELMEQRDDIWICRADVLVPLMTALRNEIQHVSRIRSATELSEVTKDIVFDYLTSADFTRRVTTMMEGYGSMRSSLDKQKRQFNQRMSEQERALDNMLIGISGVHGDLSQLVGPSLKPVPGLELDDFMEDGASVLELSNNTVASES